MKARARRCLLADVVWRLKQESSVLPASGAKPRPSAVAASCEDPKSSALSNPLPRTTHSGLTTGPPAPAWATRQGAELPTSEPSQDPGSVKAKRPEVPLPLTRLWL